MTACPEFLELMSTSLDQALPPDEQARLDKHLADCPECRTALKELRWTHAQIRKIEAVETPPWMASKIMARIRSEAAPQPSFWRRFIRPVVIKPQLQVASILLLAATGFYLLRSQRPRSDVFGELKQEKAAAPLSSQPAKSMESRDKLAPGFMNAPKEMQKPLSEGANKLRTEDSKPSESGFAPPPKTAAPPIQAAPPAPALAKQERDLARSEPVAAAPPAPSALAGASVGTVVAGVAESEAIPAQQSKKSSKGGDGPAGANRASEEARGRTPESAGQLMDQSERKDKSDTAIWLIRMEMADPREARLLIERELTRVGANVMPQRQTDDPRVLRARFDTHRLPDLLSRLARIGKVLEQPDTQGEKPSLITISISW